MKADGVWAVSKKNKMLALWERLGDYKLASSYEPRRVELDKAW